MARERLPARQEHSARSERRHQRGAVLLGAVFMAAFLVGTLWYLVGIGDAAIHRQLLQDGADATVYTASVIHARGMNVLAMLNLVMAAVLMVLVAFKVAQLLLIAANVAACIAGAFLNPVCDALTAYQPVFANTVSRVENIVDKILRGLHLAESGVTLAVPWVAEAKSIAMASRYPPTVSGGLSLSETLVPWSSSGGLSAPGLPVEDDAFSVLCGRSGRILVDFVFLPLGGVGDGVKSFAGDLVQGLVTSFPGYFCGEGGDTGMSRTDLATKSREACQERGKKIWEHNAFHRRPGEPATPFDMSACVKNIDSAIGSAFGGGGLGGGSEKSPKRVSEGASNGGDPFAVWSFTWGDLDHTSTGRKGVAIATHGGTAVLPPSFLTRFGFAKGEFYYEPEDDSGKDWSDVEEDALWNMRWRARLRRVRFGSASRTQVMLGAIASVVGRSQPAFNGIVPLLRAATGALANPRSPDGRPLPEVAETMGGLVPVITH